MGDDLAERDYKPSRVPYTLVPVLLSPDWASGTTDVEGLCLAITALARETSRSYGTLAVPPPLGMERSLYSTLEAIQMPGSVPFSDASFPSSSADLK